MKNYLTETEIKYWIPELAKYLWTSETTFTAQKTAAEQTVIRDLVNKGYILRQLQTPLYLSSDSVEDTISRMRLVINSASAGTIDLLGSNDEEDWGTISTTTIVSGTRNTDITSTFTQTYKFYCTDSTLADSVYTAYLVETIYDSLFAYKWLELILLDSVKQDGDQFHLKMLYFQNEYQNLLGNMKISVDTNEDGDIDEEEIKDSGTINLKR